MYLEDVEASGYWKVKLNNDKTGLAEIMYCALIYVVLDVRHTTGRTN